MKSKEEIEALKKSWRYDPIWDIEETEGFEDHKDELKAYREQVEMDWKVNESNRLIEKSISLVGNPDAINLVKNIEYLQRQIEQLQRQIEQLRESF